MHSDHQDENFDDSESSKSQRKRESQAMHDLGIKLVKLGKNTLKQLPLDEEVMAAVLLAQKIENKREGYRRQLQFIGKLLRQRDTDALLAKIDEIENHSLYQAAHFHAIERWRDRIINDGDDGIQAFIDDYPRADRQQLRQYVRQAQKEQEQHKPPAASRALFKYLRSIVDSQA
ncbi:ribosome biogenesis factor YjgA [Aliidiomarina indica]|uniref:ribosome biogenesis factor YjgA n=1 Tax=Aliidiomarina indica TaxID=2749147 RepID=UPI00188E6A97|nr:ribosome biogenesis factor YjgA [Aliidiomarina indica]